MGEERDDWGLRPRPLSELRPPEETVQVWGDRAVPMPDHQPRPETVELVTKRLLRRHRRFTSWWRRLLSRF